ncbi:hypothetical protein PROFUN_00569 [Planoprotostelium fungivorum]|uniref:eRF1/Pelota-like N-terminal domain-containing protein n=1 Tax=Planoprotostelium fungivorum TaxID=1890364 RepID=A0A2P6N165_9EUKA|nr:hypothetical protein PROFUN_00569 [Planoprotostelium fungivorum]
MVVDKGSGRIAFVSFTVGVCTPAVLYNARRNGTTHSTRLRSSGKEQAFCTFLHIRSRKEEEHKYIMEALLSVVSVPLYAACEGCYVMYRMKLKRKEISKEGDGEIVLLPEEPEDMWHAYNLISQGDQIRSTTVRRVQSETATGSSSSERVRVTLTIEVDTIEFDSVEGVLRLKGKNITENRFVKLGAYHTLELELNREFSLIKPYWDSIALEQVTSATDPTKYADAGAIVMSEGLAHICLITSTMTITRSRIEVSIPRKGKGTTTNHEKGLGKFFEMVMQAMLRHFNFDVIKCVVIGSPGFVKDQFFDYMNAEAIKQDNKLIFENKNKFILVHTSSGHKHALKEALSDPGVAVRLADTKAAGEMRALTDFYDLLKNDPDRAFYGFRHVELANERQAIQVLMVTDELFRSSDIKTRKKYVQLVESVRENGGEVKLFSSAHISGEQLTQLSGIAAMLRFPLPDVDDELEQSDEEVAAEETTTS